MELERPRSRVAAQDGARPANRHDRAHAGRRIVVGYTCAASANIVVWVALIMPPVKASIAMISSTGVREVFDIRLRVAAPAMAIAVSVSIVAASRTAR